MTYTTTENLQKHLTSKGFYKKKIDNTWGRFTDKALLEFLDTRSGKLTFKWVAANFQRRLIAAWQLICLEAGVHEVGAIDGYRGPSTDNAIDILESLERTGLRPNWREEREEEPPLPLTEPTNAIIWPHQKNVSKYYGNVGQNQTMLYVPYMHKIAWEPHKTIARFSIHEKCHDSALRVLTRVLDHYGPERIVQLRLDYWAGCLNVRPMKGTKNTPSMHSWGIAIDYDSERNQYKWGRDRASFAKPDYDKWWELWEEEGWLSLGRARNYDWMHVQAARV